MTSRFQTALRQVLDIEGGGKYHHNRGDYPTKWGIALHFYKAQVDGDATATTIRDLSYEDAASIYYKYFWQNPPSTTKGISLEDVQLGVGELLFNFFVNMGGRRGTLVTQKALRRMGHRVSVDGVLGPNTVQTINSIGDAPTLISWIAFYAIEFYLDLARRKPQFRDGWIRRAIVAAMQAYGATDTNKL